MLDQVLLRAIRRYWDQAQCEAVYERLLTAYLGRTESVTVIIGKSTEGDSANAQVVVQKEDYREWMETLESRIAEYEATAAGTGSTHPNVEHTDFSTRYLIP